MACNEFEKSGLLYVSGELDEHEIRQYEAHLLVCSDCRYETEEYKKERVSYYNAKNLEETPSESADKEIIRVCSVAKKRYTSAFIPLFLKKRAAAPLYILMIMAAIGGYVQYHSISAQKMSAQLLGETAAPEALASQAAVQDIPSAVALSDADSAALFDSAAAFSTTRGNMNLEGVVTVKSSE
ncbi:MAG: zf-HC2 domain-containing protein [Chitinispirillia bacterium]|nr:zf-HC2 domain-containing protein [Chitinispirillia bacterium]